MPRYIDLDRAYQDAYDDVHSRAIIDEREYDLIINFLDAQPGVWISAEERLPAKTGNYLCRYTFGNDGVMYFYQVLQYYAADPEPHWQHGGAGYALRVTHWMPLPDLPKEENT